MSEIKNDIKCDENTLVEEITEENDLIIVFKKPITFEGDVYNQVDLTGIEDMTGEQLCQAHRRFAKSKGVALTPELDPQYAAIVASIVTDHPIEFFYALPAKELANIKRAVSGYFFSED